MIFLLIITTGIVIFIEVPGLVRKNYRRELIIFSLLLSSGFLLLLLIIMGVKLPSPALFIEGLINNLLDK